MPKPKKEDPPPPPGACISCMKRPAAPHNGGLCEVCAPPLKVPKLRAFMAARRASLLSGATGGCPRSGYGLGALVPARDPLSVAYDGQTTAFIDRITHDPVVGTVLVRGGFVSRTGVVSTSILVQLPPGQEQLYQDAFRRSLHYNFRAMFTPPGRTVTGARQPSPLWLHLEWRGRRRGSIYGVVRIGPAAARPWISGQESYVDNPALRYAGASA